MFYQSISANPVIDSLSAAFCAAWVIAPWIIFAGARIMIAISARRATR